MSQSIQIYNGAGASNLCVQAWKRELNDYADTRVYKVDEFNSDYTVGLDRGHTALIIVPGGNACEMFDPLTGIAEKINQVIAGGSAFLGSCAGAIVSASNSSLQRLDFNPISFHSKYYMPKSAFVSDPENKSVIEVEWLPSKGHFQSDSCHLFHAFGPAFPLEIMKADIRKDSRVLAFYKTEGTSCSAHNSAAVILYQPSRSSPRLVTGVHPELGVADVLSSEFAAGFNKPDHPHIKALAENMQDSEVLRKQMCRSWFSELGIKVT